MSEHHDHDSYAEILLVDDDKIALLICERFMRRSGMTADIKQFHDGRAALDYLAHARPTDQRLLFLDINMPVMSGWQVLDLLDSDVQYEKLLVIILSSSVDAVDIQRSRQYRHVIQYIEKPIGVDTFLPLKGSPQMEQFFR